YTKNGSLKKAAGYRGHTALARVPGLTSPQPLQNRGRGEPVGHRADSNLERAERGTAPGTEAPVRLADVVAALHQELLQLVALGAREHAFVAGPRLRERTATAQAVSKMPDGKRIGFRRIVFHDHTEILQHEEGWPLGARRQQEICLVVSARETLAARAVDTCALPFAHREDTRVVDVEVVEARRHHDLVAPGLSADPAVFLQVVRGRRHEIGDRVNHVAPPIAVEVDGVAFERRRHELGWAERTRPGTPELMRLQVAARQYLKGGQKL